MECTGCIDYSCIVPRRFIQKDISTMAIFCFTIYQNCKVFYFDLKSLNSGGRSLEWFQYSGMAAENYEMKLL